jgi:transcriptional regulator with XRE-family HTH domain
VIQVEIDAIAILDELNALGWRDYKIEMECGFSKGYVDQIRRGNVRELKYPRAARLINLLEREERKAAACSLGLIAGISVWTP